MPMMRKPMPRVNPQALAALAAARAQQGGPTVAGMPGGAPVAGMPGGAPVQGLPGSPAPAPAGMKRGGKTKKMAKGGSASARADGIATKGLTKGKFC